MRLNQFEIESIHMLAKKHFGHGTTVFLFGSRMDDQQRGGDIDLFIQNNKEEYLTLQAKVNYLAELKRKIGDRKIDVVFDNDKTRQKKNFYRSVNKHKIEI